ncbi:sensor histidine kinase [Flavobacterium pallidum]|uniref:histidine kinase n=1 Tax=Flavobacterium pallidum TaxID=2172098 RepID=A0A2S1SJQ6_9FLAO|nr:HAMP domain-containing sensor histidine kinase [Flavobacterium pallidum]AWI26577.1 sensor histidine kinase [Flavobacterium pallidum]
MKLYASLSNVGFLKNHYAGKFLFVAFVGIHIPLIGLIFFISFYETNISPTSILLMALAMTLLATAVTLILLKKLISPIEAASKALESYRTTRTMPNLPTEHTDAAGLLMANIQSAVKINESLIQQKQDLAGLLSNDMKAFAEIPLAAAQKIIGLQPSQAIISEANAIITSAGKQKDFLETYVAILQEEEALSKKMFKVRGIKFDEIVGLIKKKFAEKLQEKDISLVTDVKIIETHLRIDSESLLTVLTNLIDNAIKYSPAGETIKLSVYRHHSHIKISVADNGAGFDAGSTKDLFRLTNMTRSDKEGKPNGMSLYLSSQIIKKAEGMFYAESGGDQQGATFFIDLKLYRRK